MKNTQHTLLLEYQRSLIYLALDEKSVSSMLPGYAGGGYTGDVERWRNAALGFLWRNLSSGLIAVSVPTPLVPTSMPSLDLYSLFARASQNLEDEREFNLWNAVQFSGTAHLTRMLRDHALCDWSFYSGALNIELIRALLKTYGNRGRK
ncbi:MAG TPA: hypothetical protein VLJ57_06860 [Burkholderiaceae bacterium]|nr:hypothetical protein [Burkholderiaceae bacterium]